MGVFIEEHGHGAAGMLLLHGFAATGAVWRRMIAALVDGWSGRVIVCDLPGHGGSTPLAAYTYPALADAIARAASPCRPLVVVGHSYGGVIAAVLASGRHGVEPAAIVATSVKVTWSEDELAGFAALATKPVKWFATRQEAEDRYRKVAGLTADVTDDPADLDRGVVEVHHQFRLSYDPASAAGAPDMAGVLAATRCGCYAAAGPTTRW